MTKWSPILAGVDLVFHLAAAVSGECESDFDLGMRSNLDATRSLLDACRALGSRPTFVFASSLAVFGGWPDLPPDRLLLHELEDRLHAHTNPRDVAIA